VRDQRIGGEQAADAAPDDDDFGHFGTLLKRRA
jgi:hypothetical protein